MSNQPPLNPDARTECVDMLLEIMGYPRDELFEYPNRADDSREYIARAERTLDKILAVAQPEGWEQQAKNFMRVIDRLTAENEAFKAAEQKAHSDAGWAANMDRQGGA